MLVGTISSYEQLEIVGNGAPVLGSQDIVYVITLELLNDDQFAMVLGNDDGVQSRDVHSDVSYGNSSSVHILDDRYGSSNDEDRFHDSSSACVLGNREGSSNGEEPVRDEQLSASSDGQPLANGSFDDRTCPLCQKTLKTKRGRGIHFISCQKNSYSQLHLR